MLLGHNKELYQNQLENCGLQEPDWSPTGEEGYWVWRDEKWSWLTDEEYEALKELED